MKTFLLKQTKLDREAYIESDDHNLCVCVCRPQPHAMLPYQWEQAWPSTHVQYIMVYRAALSIVEIILYTH